MTCLRCPQCEKDRTRIAVFPYTCSCGRRVELLSEFVAIEDCEPPRRSCGVGCRLTKTLEWLGFQDDGTCGCREFAAELDRLGPAACRKDFRRLAKKLADKAAKKGVPFAGLAAAFALMRAIRAAEKTA